MSIATETTPEAALLTKSDITALRTADEVHARRSPGSRSQLEAIQRCERRDSVFSSEASSDLRRTIPTRDRLVVYSGGGSINHDNHDDVTAFVYNVGGKWNETWATVASLLRPGDEITLEWVAGNNSSYLDNAKGVLPHGDGTETYYSGLFDDSVLLRVRRNDKDKYLFHLAHRVGPDNSARMIGRPF